MAETERLTMDRLLELESLLAEQKAPVVARFRPPASADEIAAVESVFGRELPAELKMWWGWHNGTDVKPHERAVKASIGPSFEFLNTDEAIKVSRECRDEAEDIAPEDPDSLWKKTWLAIGSYGMVACDCAVATDAPVPILKGDPHLVDELGTVAARSLGEMVRWWIEVLKTGAWLYEPEHDRWERRPELISLERDLTRLV